MDKLCQVCIGLILFYSYSSLCYTKILQFIECALFFFLRFAKNKVGFVVLKGCFLHATLYLLCFAAPPAVPAAPPAAVRPAAPPAAVRPAAPPAVPPLDKCGHHCEAFTNLQNVQGTRLSWDLNKHPRMEKMVRT